MTKNQDYSSEFAWRFVDGIVTAIHANLLYLAVAVPNRPDIKQVRLEIETGEAANYSKNQKIPLFLVNVVNDQPGLWRAADGAMADPKQNPWQQSAFSEGDILEGDVVGYVGNGAAIIALKYNLSRDLDWTSCKQFSAYLHRNQTPDAPIQPNIRDILHVGDTVQAILAGTDGRPTQDPERLHLNLDVNLLLNLRSHAEKNKEQMLPVAETGNQHAEQKTTSTERTEKRLLIIDDDKEFCKAWQKLLSSWNVKVRYHLPLPYQYNEFKDELSKELKDNIFDGCLLDCDLGLDNAEQKSIESLLQDVGAKTGMKLVKMSGDHNLAQQQNGAALEKPLDTLTVLTWLDTGDIPAQGQTKRSFYQGKGTRWRVSGSETLAIKRAEKLLKQCCRNVPGICALSVKLDRPGYYAVRAAYGISESDYRLLETHLQNTCIATAIETETELEISRAKSGAIKNFMELRHCNFIWVFPFAVDGQVERAVVFFSPDRLGELHKQFVNDQQNHFEDIVHWMAHARQLEASEIFATQGRMLASTLHELRTAASIVAGTNEALLKQLNTPLINPDDIALREGLASMSIATKRLLELSENGLDHIRPGHTSILDVGKLIEETLHLMRGRIKAQGFHATLSPLNNQLKTPLALDFPPKYLEIPLINLLDNALHYCGQRSWAQVRVSLSLDAASPETPIKILVDDSGLGMTQGQVKKLFNARETGRGAAGSGMGLYLARQLVESVGGKITLEKTVRWFGSSFSIRLPLIG